MRSGVVISWPRVFTGVMETTSIGFYRNYYELETQATFDVKAHRLHARDMGDTERVKAAEAVLRERGEGWI